MGNLLSGQNVHSKVRYKVVLPTYCRAWEQLYNGNVETWDAVAAEYGMDKFAYCCGLPNCDREAVCLRYMRATLKSDHQTINIERYKASTVHVAVGRCPELQTLLASGFRLNEVVAAERGKLALLVLHDSHDFITQANFLLVSLGDDDFTSSKEKKEGERNKLLRRFSSREGKTDEKRKSSTSSVDRKKSDGKRKTSSSSTGSGKSGGGRSDGEGASSPTSEKLAFFREKLGPQCIGVMHAPQKDMTIISCHISPDLSQTAVMLYSMSRMFGIFCYTLHCYSNFSLQGGSPDKARRTRRSASSPGTSGAASPQDPPSTPHLMQTVKLSREVQPYFAYDPRYGHSRIAVANYECRESSIAHELVVLQLYDKHGEEGREWQREGEKNSPDEKQQENGASSSSSSTGNSSNSAVSVIKRGKLSLPALFGNSRFNLLYSKDGQLVILQKLTDDRFGVTSFCDIYIFHADDLTLIKYMTSALPGLFHICKVSYEPVFSRCGSFMRLIDHRVASAVNSNSHHRGNNHGGGDEGEEYSTAVHIYQLPRLLGLMSQCRRAILQNMLPTNTVDRLPLPQKMKDYLNFGPIY